MKRTFMIVVMFTTLFAIEVRADQPPLPKLEDITKKLDEVYRATGTTHAKLTMTIVNKRGTRALQMESWSKGADTSLILIRKPAREAGTATLMTPDGLWNYAPRADRLIRIPKGLLGDSWMGSDFTNDDLVQNTKYAKDFTSKLSWVQENGKRALKIVFIPNKNVPVVYSRLEYLMEPKTWIPIRAEFFDKKKKTRTMLFSDIRKVGEKHVPFKLVLQPGDGKSSTTIQYEIFEADVKLDDAMFTKRGLRRIAKKR